MSAVRTVLDCLAVMPEAEAALLVHQTGPRIDPQSLAELGRTGLPGAPALRTELRVAAPGSASEPERLFARALIRRGVRMITNHPIGRYRGDFVDTRARVVVELDGREFHSAPDAFVHDRVRQNSLVLADWLVLRYAAATVLRTVDACADEVAAVVRRRRRSRG